MRSTDRITPRNGITRAKLHRMGYRKVPKGSHYWKRRKVRGGKGWCLVQIQPFCERWSGRGKPEACNVNSRETGDSGPNHSTVYTMAHLRDWERFAFQP